MIHQLNRAKGIFLVATLFLLPLVSFSAETRSFFLIGNSLTWDTVPSKLDGDVQWHVDCGKPLPYIKANPDKPCVKTSTLWPKALSEKQYDVVSFQPHYGSNLSQDLTTISHWIEMQKKAEIVIHTGWARQVSRAEEYNGKEKGGKMTHSPEYIADLIRRLKRRFPDRVFKQTHAQDYLNKVALDIKSGKAPFNKLEDVYRDAIHMNVVTGCYLMHNAMRLAMGQPRSAVGFEKIPSEIKTYFDKVLDSGLK